MDPIPLEGNSGSVPGKQRDYYNGCDYAVVFGRKDPERKIIVFLTTPDYSHEESQSPPTMLFRGLVVSNSDFMKAYDFFLPPRPENDPRLTAALGGRSLQRIIGEGRLICYYSTQLDDLMPDWREKAKPLKTEDVDKYFPRKK